MGTVDDTNVTDWYVYVSRVLVRCILTSGIDDWCLGPGAIAISSFLGTSICAVEVDFCAIPVRRLRARDVGVSDFDAGDVSVSDVRVSHVRVRDLHVRAVGVSHIGVHTIGARDICLGDVRLRRIRLRKFN